MTIWRADITPNNQALDWQQLTLHSFELLIEFLISQAELFNTGVTFFSSLNESF